MIKTLKQAVSLSAINIISVYEHKSRLMTVTTQAERFSFQERHVIIKSFNRESDLQDDVNGFYVYQDKEYNNKDMIGEVQREGGK